MSLQGNTMRVILHIATAEDWQQSLAAGRYVPATLATEGFIHCSTVSQTVETANRFFAGREGLLLLCIDEGRVQSEVRYELPATRHDERYEERFPHIYGPLNLDSVFRVIDFAPRSDGWFELPAEIDEIDDDERFHT